MKPFGIALPAGIFLLLIAFGLARLSQLLSAHVPWPLLALFIGGGLGTGAALIWQQRWIKSWPALLAWCVVATIVLAAAEHYFAWQNLIAAQEAEWLKTIREQPRLGTFPSPFEPPTFTRFMSGGDEPWRTWAWWISDATAKGLIAMVVLFLRRNSASHHFSPAEATR